MLGYTFEHTVYLVAGVCVSWRLGGSSVAVVNDLVRVSAERTVANTAFVRIRGLITDQSTHCTGSYLYTSDRTTSNRGRRPPFKGSMWSFEI